MWPPNYPDLSPVDCKIWIIEQQRIYETRDNDVDDRLKLVSWSGLQANG